MILSIAILAASLFASLEIRTPSEIATNGATIVIEAGTCAERHARQNFPSNRTITCLNVHDGIMALEGRKADALVYDRPYLDYAALNRKAIKVLDENIGNFPIPHSPISQFFGIIPEHEI